jgi:hypothetical protein
MTAYTNVRASSPAYMQAFGNAFRGNDLTSVTAALGVGDTIDLIKLPGGLELDELQFDHDDMDTGATLVIKIGYRPAAADGVLQANDSAFGAGFTFLQAASAALNGRERLAVPAMKFNEDVIVFATVTTAAVGQSAGAKSIRTFASGIARGTK